MTEDAKPTPNVPVLTVHELFAERERIEAEKAAAEQAAERRAAAELEERRRAFEARPLTEAECVEIEQKIHAAFDAKERELMILSFPSAFCPDGGRHINHALEGWEQELPGYARRVHDFWESRLKPGGFGFNARVINYPHGMPGDIGLFVTWPEADA